MFVSFVLSTLLLSAPASASSRAISYKEVVGHDFDKFEKGSFLFQNCYYGKTDSLYITRAAGRRPVTESNILVADASDLKLIKNVKAPVDNITGVESNLGIACDDKHQRVWVTNTHQATLSYFDVSKNLTRTIWPFDSIKHPRDIAVDPKTGYAWATSASTLNTVLIFSANKTDGPIKVVNISKQAPGFSFPMSIVIDPESRTLFTVSFKKQRVVAINMETYKIKQWKLKNSMNSTGIAYDTKRKHIWVANYATNNSIVLDTKSGKVIKEIGFKASPLNVAYDPKFDVMYVSCFRGDGVYALDPEDFSIISEFNIKRPDRVSIGPNGEVFVNAFGKPALSKWVPTNGTKGDNDSQVTHGGGNGGNKPVSAKENSASKSTLAFSALVIAGIVGGASALL